MKRLAVLLLLFGVVAGLTLQPTQAFAAPLRAMDMTSMSDVEIAAMPGCMAAMSKDATPAPCKCGIAGCIAMMVSVVPMMLSDESVSVKHLVNSAAVERYGVSTTLIGRTTAPEPEPPSALI